MKSITQTAQPTNGLIGAVNFDDPKQAAIGFYLLKARQRQQAATERKIVALANRKARVAS